MNKRGEHTSLLNRWKQLKDKNNLNNNISPAPADAIILPSREQQRIWLLQKFYPESPFYNYSAVLQFDGLLNDEALIFSIQRIVLEQEVLRSSYPLDNDQPVLKIDEEMELPLQRYDFSDLGDNEQAQKLLKLYEQISHGVFDLSVSPLLRFALIKCGERKSILFATFHHIIIDEWSFDIFKSSLAHHYTGYIDNKQDFDNETSVRFRDYTYWERHQTNFKTQISYWKELLSGDLSRLDLGNQNKVAVNSAFEGSNKRLDLPSHLSEKALKLAQELKVTPFVLFMGICKILLYRYSQQNDIIIGTPVSMRDDKSLEQLIGFFLNTLVVRSKLSAETPFKEYLLRLNKIWRDAFAHKEMPFDMLVKEINPGRSLEMNPLFNVMFLYYSVPNIPSFGAELNLTKATEYNIGASKFDLTFAIEENQANLSLLIEYSTEVFAESDIVQMQEHYILLLQGIVEDPALELASIPMLTAREERFFFGHTSYESTRFSDYRAIHQVIKNIGLLFPNRIAVQFDHESLSYGKLLEQARNIGQAIMTQTKGQNAIVGLCLDRSVDMISGMLGILMAGCAYLPLDPEYPADRLKFILKDSKAELVLTNASTRSSLANTDIPRILLEELPVNHEKIDLPKSEADDLAYVIYTSGSTGNPKGVPITHANILNSTEGRLDFYDSDPEVFLLLSSIAFDSSKAGIFWTLCTGGTLLIAPNRVEQDMQKLSNLISEYKVSHTLMLPSLYKILMESSDPEDLLSLRCVIVAGEACTTSLCEIHFKNFSQIPLYNEYGPTEATVWCTAHQIKENNLSGPIPIGKPVANAKIYLLSESRELVPYGAKGEIYIGGPGLSGQYLNQPQITTDSFIKNPFSEVDEKIYRTGDLGRYLPDGSIEFLGRADEQVKIRGYRIELNEVAKTISEETIVEEAVVFAAKPSYEYDAIPDNPENLANELLALLESNFDESALENLISSITSMDEAEMDFMLEQLKNR